MNRATTPEGALETIFALARVTPRVDSAEEIFRGHPLAAPPTGAAAVFYGVWPAVVLASAWLIRWRQA
jgi:hypothetical protein